MKQFLRVVAVAVLLLSISSFSLVPRASAANQGFNILTSPLPIKISTTPGSTVTTELRVKNQSDQPEGIKVGLLRFGATGDSGTPNIYELTAKDSYGKWVSFNPQQFIAQPNVWVTIKMTISVPADAGLGYYLAVTYSPVNQPGARDVTNLRGSAATMVLLDVKSANASRKLSLLDFSTKHKLYEYLPVNFDVKLRNTGNIYLSPSGNIFIQQHGKTIETLDFNAAGGSVLPQSNRVFAVPWADGFPNYVDRVVNGKPSPDEKGVPKQSLKWDFTHADKFRFGKFNAKLLIAYDNGKQDVPIESNVTFWVLPWKIMIIGLLLALAVLYGIFTIVRSAFGKAKRGAGKYKRRGKK